LVCGPFPLSETSGRLDYEHGDQCIGFHEDLLKSNGGESGADPREGDPVRSARTGEKLTWRRHRGAGEEIHFDEFMEPNDVVVAYAFCHVTAARAGQYILAIGSNDGVKVFLNGKTVHTHHLARWLDRDDDFVVVHLVEGVNRLLIKVDEGSGDWGFAARILDYDKTVSGIKADLAAHRRLAIVTNANAISAYFGEPYAIGTLNPEGLVRMELVHESEGLVSLLRGKPGMKTTFDLADVPNGLLTLRASFPLNDQETIVAERRHFKGRLERHGRPARIGVDLALRDAEGEPVFPIGMHGVLPSEYSEFKAAGFTVVVGAAADLDAASAAGLKMGVIVEGVGDHWVDQLRKTVREYKDHPAVAFWQLYMEPGDKRADLYTVHQAYQAIHEEDGTHPSYVSTWLNTIYETFGRCCDVLAIEGFPVSRSRMVTVYENLASAYEASDGDQPVWHVGQLFAFPRDRLPTEKEHRLATYLALMAGAKGAMWYQSREDGEDIRQHTPLWRAHQQLVKEIQGLSAVLLSPGVGERTTVFGDRGQVRAVTKASNGKRFVMAGNLSGSEVVSCQIIVGDTPMDGTAKVYGTDRTVEIKSGRLADTFEPMDVHVYELN
jgi:hypothetical protein